MSAAAGTGGDGARRRSGSTDRRVPRLSEAIYRGLLLLFPTSFRRQHGHDAVELFRDRLREAGGGGPWVLAAFWARNVADVIRQGVSDRRDEARRVRRATAFQAPSPGGRRAGGVGQLLPRARVMVRSLARSPVYAIVVIVVFALTIMAVTTVLSSMESLLWRPLPFPEPDRLVFVGETSPGSDGAAYVTSRYVLERVRRNVEGLRGVASFNIWEAVLTGGGEAVVVISHRLWRARFGGDAGVIGRPIELNGNRYQVVGVMPEGMETPDQYTFTRTAPDVWRPDQSNLSDPEQVGEPGRNFLRGVARLAPTADLSAVEAELEALRHAIGEDYARWAEGARIAALPLQRQFTHQMRPVLWILAGAVGMVLLVGSVNVMTLIVSRTIDRGHEYAVRSALGAGGAHLVGHSVFEALSLALPGGVVGVIAAYWSLRALVAVSPAGPRVESLSIGPISVMVALAATLAAALLAGLVPGLRLLRPLSSGDLSLRSRQAAVAGGLAHSLLAGAQVALAVTLLIGAGLLARSFQALLGVDPGFDQARVYVAQLDLPPARYESVETRTVLTDQLARSLEALADVAEAGFVTSVPQHGLNDFSSGIGIAGREDDPDDPPWALFRGASPGYFDAAGLRLLRGRTLQVEDFKDGAPTGVVVNEELERRYFDGESALGATLQVLGQEELEVVGVVGNVQYGWFGNDPQPETYAPWQGRFFTVFLVVKAASADADIAALMKHEVQTLDADLPMEEVWRLEDLTAETLAATRLPMVLMLILAGFAVLLSAMGTYGVIAHMVARRTAEIGVRMALGARAGSVLGLVVGRILRIAIAGSAVGLILAWAGARLLESQLFGIRAHDPVTFAVVSVFLVVVSLLACLQPARRAARVDPVIALRSR